MEGEAAKAMFAVITVITANLAFAVSFHLHPGEERAK